MLLSSTPTRMSGMTRSRPFAQVDVFSSEPYRGNPVAVFLDGEGLTEEQMLGIANWTNLSETSFLLPPTTSEADYRVRIFTPGGELSFAGHPTLGSAHAWLENGGIPRDSDLIVQECEAGLVDVRRNNNSLSFAAPPMVRTGELEAELLKKIITAFGITAEQVLAHQFVDNGSGWTVIRLATAQEVLDLEPDLSLIPEAMVGAIGAYPEGAEHDFEMRTFAPGVGVAEDPVCGSMNASVGQWLISTGAVKGSYRVSQGVKVGRSGDIAISADNSGRVWVGGSTTTLFRGSALA